MASLSNYAAKKILDHLLGGTTFSPEASVNIRLYTSTPSPSGGGTEVSGGGYVAKSITNNSTNWPDTVLGTGDKFLGVAAEWSAASANWGIVTSWAIWDAANANMLIFGTLNTPITINTGDIFRWPAGANGLKVNAS